MTKNLFFFAGLNSVPTCIISRVRYLSRSGWVDVKNYSIAEYHHEHSVPFKLFHDKHRTFLQVFMALVYHHN